MQIFHANPKQQLQRLWCDDCSALLLKAFLHPYQKNHAEIDFCVGRLFYTRVILCVHENVLEQITPYYVHSLRITVKARLGNSFLAPAPPSLLEEMPEKLTARKSFSNFQFN